MRHDAVIIDGGIAGSVPILKHEVKLPKYRFGSLADSPSGGATPGIFLLRLLAGASGSPELLPIASPEPIVRHRICVSLRDQLAFKLRWHAAGVNGTADIMIAPPAGRSGSHCIAGPSSPCFARAPASQRRHHHHACESSVRFRCDIRRRGETPGTLLCRVDAAPRER